MNLLANFRKEYAMPFSLVRNDLTAIYADAIVITANEHLRITGGVGAMVAQAAGFEALQNACNKIGFCETGHAVATPNFNLANTRMIIHAVGPFWHDGDEHERTLLRSAYDSALNCAFHKGAESIALPLISAGSFGCPPEISLEIAREAIRAFLETHEADVTLVLFDKTALQAGLATYRNIAEYIDDHYVEKSTCARQDARRRFDPETGLVIPQDEEAIIADQLLKAACPMQPMGIGRFVQPTETAFDSSTLDAPDLISMLESLDASFSTTLLELIDARGISDAQVYKRANVSRQLFSKIRSDAAYKPTKKTALALAIALELNLDETEDLLRRAGFALSNASKADVIVEYFIRSKNYDIFEINEALYAFDQPLL